MIYGVHKDELISNILLWSPAHGHASVGRPAKTYINPLRTKDATKKTCPEQWMIGMEGERERARELCAVSATWWWILIFTIQIRLSFNHLLYFLKHKQYKKIMSCPEDGGVSRCKETEGRGRRLDGRTWARKEAKVNRVSKEYALATLLHLKKTFKNLLCCLFFLTTHMGVSLKFHIFC